ncbi:Crp/Fnr family transcriptional regulator [Sphingomonas sp. MMS24-JH45]
MRETAADIPPGEALLRRLGRCNAIPEERALVERDVAEVRSLAPHQPCIRQGQTPRHVFLVAAGWMMRWQVPDGSRQVTGFLLPGDFCNDAAAVEHGFDAGYRRSGARARRRDPSEAIASWEAKPALGRALAWGRVVEQALLRSWIVGVGRRDAYGRLSYLLCQLHARLDLVGAAHDQGFVLPATQEHLADALGLTPVHVNRVLKRLREDGLVDIRRSRVHLLEDLAALRERAGFSDRDILLGAARTRRKARSWPTPAAWA